ncbi:General transcription and DNA repair factor IIH helicase subunit XPB2 (TFIIH subunit XPB) (ERCC3 homolog 2) (RAD25 homolog 2) (AtXPB2) (XPB homolog 2) [Durusdinium trenchii]|uniref:DNA 3'-5' helicase n=1 Tax=Durusdinium trenchii TaxID=1381693 RepID=A0ABP0SEF3_9DINO
MQADHTQRPLWVHESGRIYFESFHVQAAQVADFLIAIAEPVSRPQVIHEYQITSLSLTAAIANGISVEQIIKVLVKLSKNVIQESFLSFIRAKGRVTGKLRLVLREGRHFLESEDEQLLRQLKTHEEVAECVVDAASSEVDSLKVEKLKAAAHQLGFPLLQEYEFRRDRAEGNPPLPAVLRPNVNLRPYQQRALAKMFSVEEVAKSGIVVLPCGAGKTLLGIAACCRVGRRALVLTTTAVAVDQWRRQLQMYTTLPPEDVYLFTADQKRPIEDAERKACVVISTYSMLGFTGRRGGDTAFILEQLQQLEWGLLVVDEVQVMPARTFRTVATTIKSHCCLGLTATLVREDDLIQDLHWLIGPKLYEANWQQLQDDGYLAKVRCIEVWCDMAEEFFMEYLQAQDGGDVPGSMRGSLQRALWTCNPNKLKTCEFLIRLHEQRGDKIIVFSDNIFILKEFARKLGRYYICGSVSLRERMQILSEFQESSACNTIFLSKVGDNAIDLPVANVIVQISSHYGSRRQEAQRLGRILRPKPQAKDGTGGFNAFFYSVVSRDTQELYHANRRQQFLVEQGYNYQVVRDYNVTRLEQQNLIYSSKDSQLQLLKQVLESVRRGEAEEADEVLEPGCETPRMETAPSKAEKVEKVEGKRPKEEKVSLASLSGGLDGSYTAAAPKFKRLKTQ